MDFLVRALRRLARIIETGPLKDIGRGSSRPPALRDEFEQLPFAGHAMQKLLDDYTFETVLDIGSGEGRHADLFIQHGKTVTALDYGESVYFQRRKDHDNINVIVADFNEHNFETTFDCAWCSHILEHQLNPHAFLHKVNSVVKEGGVLAMTVPPLKDTIVGGHVSLWTAGLLLYHLVLVGLDCREARILRYGYNISVLLEKRSIDARQGLAYDAGDIRKIKHFLPDGLHFHPNPLDDPFEGDIYQLNWGS